MFSGVISHLTSTKTVAVLTVEIFVCIATGIYIYIYLYNDRVIMRSVNNQNAQTIGKQIRYCPQSSKANKLWLKYLRQCVSPCMYGYQNELFLYLAAWGISGEGFLYVKTLALHAQYTEFVFHVLFNLGSTSIYVIPSWDNIYLVTVERRIKNGPDLNILIYCYQLPMENSSSFKENRVDS